MLKWGMEPWRMVGILTQNSRRRFEPMAREQDTKELKAKEAELRAIYGNFPHPRNEPGQAVDALHRSRKLWDRIQELLKKIDGRTLSQQQEQDA